LRQVGKTFAGRHGDMTALDGVNLNIADREFVSIVGASGCGKSTLLNLLAGFDTATCGDVTVDGAPIRGPGPDRGVVFQQTALFPWLSVEDNIAFGLKLRANSHKGSPEAIVERMLQRTGLAAFRSCRPAELSGGMRQRAAIASVLAIQPSTLLMDEPFAALDALTRSIMQDFLLEIWEEERKTALLVTHDIDEAIYLADRAIIMTARPGRVREIIDVDLPRPRCYDMRSEKRFIALRDHVVGIVREEAMRGAAEIADSRLRDDKSASSTRRPILPGAPSARHF
jgi:ABC-type nitrate/sulfonate/bicarbonate transport system ATPase subunit